MTLEDIGLLQAFQDQTVMAVRAPEETKLEIPVPTEVSRPRPFLFLIKDGVMLCCFDVCNRDAVLQESVRVHLKASQGPITVVTCELGSGPVTPGSSTCFLPLEESRVRTRTQTAGLDLLLRSTQVPVSHGSFHRTSNVYV